jgi:hypothetical protein
MSDNNNCCGEMFPDLDRLNDNAVLRGQVFRVLVTSQGIGISGRKVEVDAEQWLRCVACEQYRNCYDLSIAKLLLRLALHSTT